MKHRWKRKNSNKYAKHGSGRFTVSEGIAPCDYSKMFLDPHYVSQSVLTDPGPYTIVIAKPLEETWVDVTVTFDKGEPEGWKQ